MGRYKWRWDPDNWPDQRIIWKDLSRSQKSYTIDQYNKARRTRNLAAVPNPFRKGNNTATNPIVQNPSGVETVTPQTPNRPRLQPLSDAGSGIVPSRGRGPIIDAFKTAEGREANAITRREQREINDLSKYFNTAGGKAFLNSVIEENNTAESVQFSGSQAPHRPVVSDKGAGPSRPDTSVPADVSQPSEMSDRGAKRNHPEGGFTATNVSPAAKTGKGSPADGGFDSAQGPETMIQRGSYSSSAGFKTYTSVHHNNALALPFLNVLETHTKWTTTPLNEIPWDRMFYYMSEDEFKLIPAGSEVVDCKISVQNIISSTQYATAGSTSETATFNHPKIGMLGFDLERTMRGGKTMQYTMSSTKEMIVDSVATPNYDSFIAKQYGTDQSSATWDADDLPGCVFPIPYNSYRYFSVYQPNKLLANTQGYTAANAPGYENFSSAITQFNLNDRTWDTVFEREYKFSSARIGEPFKQLEIHQNDIEQSVGSDQAYSLNRKISEIGVDKDTVIEYALFKQTQSKVPLVTYKSRIEQGSNISVGTHIMKPARQPTVHFGMKAIPKISSLTNGERASDFVHAQVYYVVTATMNVRTNSYPNRFNLPKVNNVTVENFVAGTGRQNPVSNDSNALVTFGLSETVTV
uniref:VP n=1 Tax=uncultured densovirus TaxID=748192 RepID=A0A7M4CBJ5_9VIRU|nr:VP [uncultured densovirus]